jgi:hypothetical protein
MVEAIAKLCYQVGPGVEKYQFVKPVPGYAVAGSDKIDLLTGPQDRLEGTKSNPVFDWTVLYANAFLINATNCSFSKGF